MKHLRLNVWSMPSNGMGAQQQMLKLGITWQYAVPQSIIDFDCWDFWNCENIPTPLPKFLKEFYADPHGRIGFGLTLEMANAIKAKQKAHKAKDKP